MYDISNIPGQNSQFKYYVKVKGLHDLILYVRKSWLSGLDFTDAK